MSSAGLQQLLSRLAGISSAVGIGGWILNESLYNVDGGHNACVPRLALPHPLYPAPPILTP